MSHAAPLSHILLAGFPNRSDSLDWTLGHSLGPSISGSTVSYSFDALAGIGKQTE